MKKFNFNARHFHCRVCGWEYRTEYLDTLDKDETDRKGLCRSHEKQTELKATA